MSTNKHPNVIIIMTDQRRAEYMGCAGDSPVGTPNARLIKNCYLSARATADICRDYFETIEWQKINY